MADGFKGHIRISASGVCGASARVWLDDIEISHIVQSVTVVAHVEHPIKVKLVVWPALLDLEVPSLIAREDALARG